MTILMRNPMLDDGFGIGLTLSKFLPLPLHPDLFPSTKISTGVKNYNSRNYRSDASNQTRNNGSLPDYLIRYFHLIVYDSHLA